MPIELIIYLAGISEGITIFLMLFGIMGGAVALFPAMERGRMTPFGAVAALVGVLALLLAAAIPSERSIYMMAGAHMGKEVIQSETGKKVHKLLDKKLDEYLQTLERTGR